MTFTLIIPCLFKVLKRYAITMFYFDEDSWESKYVIQQALPGMAYLSRFMSTDSQVQSD